MSCALTIFATTFLLLVGLTLVVPGFPPAQLLSGYLRMPQITWAPDGFSIATLLKGIINGGFWAIVADTVYGLAQLVIQTRRRPLPPMPVAPHLAAMPPENRVVDSRIDRIPPALTIQPRSSFAGSQKKANRTRSARGPKRKHGTQRA